MSGELFPKRADPNPDDYQTDLQVLAGVVRWMPPDLLTAIGGKRNLDAVLQALNESPFGRALVERRDASAREKFQLDLKISELLGILNDLGIDTTNEDGDEVPLDWIKTKVAEEASQLRYFRRKLKAANDRLKAVWPLAQFAVELLDEADSVMSDVALYDVMELAVKHNVVVDLDSEGYRDTDRTCAAREYLREEKAPWLI